MLNNRHYSPEEQQAIRELFLSKEDIPEQVRHLPYQTKVEIFEKKCKNCPFAFLRVTEVLNKASGELANEYTFIDFDSFNDFILRFAFAKNFIAERGCTFGNEEIANSRIRPQYWNVDEVVTNSCDLWNTNISTLQEQKLDNEFWQWYFNQALVYPQVGSQTSFETLRLLHDDSPTSFPQLQPSIVR